MTLNQTTPPVNAANQQASLSASDPGKLQETIEKLQAENARLIHYIKRTSIVQDEYDRLRGRFLVRMVMKHILPNKHRFPLRQVFNLVEKKPNLSSIPLRGDLNSKVRAPIDASNGVILCLHGWAYHPELDIETLEITLDNQAYPVVYHSYPRPDVLTYLAGHYNDQGRSLTTGFLAHLSIPAQTENREIEVGLRARLANSQTQTHAITTITVQGNPPPVEKARIPTGSISGVRAAEPLVAICMATYNPPIDLFIDQIDSIRKQTYQNWVCIINDDCSDAALYGELRAVVADDPRFQCFRNERNLGFYLNFERALRRVPEGAAFVSLVDQDDHWFPDKIEVTLAAFTPETTLVYCDQQIITRDNEMISPSYWVGRRNNFTDYRQLLLANTVTGAASIFRATLLKDALPFPPREHDLYHDQWIGAVAMTRGKLGYVDRALYQYRQHGANVIGHYVAQKLHFLPDVSTVWRWARSGTQKVWNEIEPTVNRDADTGWIATFMPAFLAKSLLLRVPDAPPDRIAILRQISVLDQSRTGWLQQVIAAGVERRVTMRAELRGLRGLMAMRMRSQRAKNRRDQLRQQVIDEIIYGVRQEGYALRDLIPDGPASVESSSTTLSQKASTSAATIDNAGQLFVVRHVTEPLRIDLKTEVPTRVNIVLSTINFRILFGGYFGMFSLALNIAKAGYRVRVVLTQETDYRPDVWRKEFKKYAGLEKFLDQVEVSYHLDRTVALECNPDDRFLSTSWHTSFVVRAALEKMNHKEFIFFIQEYEPIFYAASTLYAMSEESYTFPHKAIFSTDILRDYFKQKRLGVYTAGEQAGNADSTVIQNPIAHITVTPDLLRAHDRPRLLFYARPEDHAMRNLFELGVLALQAAIQENILDPNIWEFHGIGSLGGSAQTLRLTPKAWLILQPKVGLTEYYQRLTRYDVGLSLMLTPHPSLPPFDMAAAGMVTVTNTYANKTAEALTAITPNLIGVPPTVPGIKEGLRQAVARIPDFEGRVAGANLRWARDWDQALGGPVMEKIKAFLALPPSR